MSTAEQVVTFRARNAGATSLAFRIVNTETGEMMWIPKSQILEPKDPFAEVNEEEITIPIWLAKQKGLV